MLQIKNLFVSYGKVNIIQDLSMEINSGEVVALIGANGTGKTTLVRAISKLNTVSGGTITFDGEDITSLSPDKIVERGIIQVPEGRKLFAQMNVRENLEMGAFAKRARAKEKENLEYVYSVFPELKAMEKQACGNLSGGQQQMVAIGRSLMAEPKLLILDEPSIGLSPITTQHMFDAIRTINKKGISILITEQNVQDVLKMASRAYVMQQGRIALSGEAQEISKSEELKKIYLGM
ncbi:MAG: ABC transporter ATP-binding protein [Clostridia bacterium]|nr:ABC transporter ATP-binding protein [Clostridia bacterium]